MKIKILLLLTCVTLLSACALVEEQSVKTQEIAEETAQNVLYHGGAPKTPEETLAQTLADAGTETPLCPDCATELSAVLTDSEELRVQQQDCQSMLQGTDAIYKLSLTYEWTCPTCGYVDSGHTVEGTSGVVCHGWTG